jgi:septum formation protein
MLPLVLASASPRRRELLARFGIPFEVAPSDVDEEALTVADPYRTAEDLARAKARAIATLRPEAFVIGADTVVALPEGTGFRQFSKPVDAADAHRILRALSGHTHRVITGVACIGPDGEETFHDETWVTFRDLSDVEIAAYVATGEPRDKAGAYGCQGGARDFIVAMEGSFSNVMGLPLERLAQYGSFATAFAIKASEIESIDMSPAPQLKPASKTGA